MAVEAQAAYQREVARILVGVLGESARHQLAAVAVFALLPLGASSARAQRLVFQTGDGLYSASADGRDPRRLIGFGATLPVAWAISPDGRRIVYANFAPQAARAEPANGSGLLSRPLAFRLTDIVGRRMKPLGRTDGLRDRQGKRITTAGILPADLPPLLGADPFPARASLDSYQLRGLAFSADSRTLYVSCVYSSPGFGESGEPVSLPATFALDAATGAPVVDAQGRWKSLAPAAPLEARGGLLVGVGVGLVPGDAPYAPLVAVNLGEGTRQSLFTPSKSTPDDSTSPPSRPAYADAREVALAPENRAILLTTGTDGSGGLWRTDKFGKSYTLLLAGNVRRPRFTPDGKQVFVLLPRPGVTGSKPVLDLYALPFDETATPDPALAPAPVLIRQGVEWFDLVPE